MERKLEFFKTNFKTSQNDWCGSSSVKMTTRHCFMSDFMNRSICDYDFIWKNHVIKITDLMPAELILVN